jgi:hypothetical protein
LRKHKKQPQRVREYLNRTVTSIVWDKKRTARTTETSKSFKPKQDENGVIVCKTEKNQQACLYADGVRKLRQREYDNADLYSDTETAQAEHKEKLQENFIEYFDAAAKKTPRQQFGINYCELAQSSRFVENFCRRIFAVFKD